MRIKHRYNSQADEKVLSKPEKGKQFCERNLCF